MTGEENPRTVARKICAVALEPTLISYRIAGVPPVPRDPGRQGPVIKLSDAGGGLDLAYGDAVEEVLGPGPVEPAGAEVLSRFGATGHAV